MTPRITDQRIYFFPGKNSLKCKHYEMEFLNIATTVFKYFLEIFSYLSSLECLHIKHVLLHTLMLCSLQMNNNNTVCFSCY